MRIQAADLGTITIAQSGSNSTGLNLHKKPLRGISIFAPDALTGSVSIEVSGDRGVTYKTLYSGGSTVVIPAGGCVVLDYAGWDAIRVVSAGTEALAREFVLRGVEQI